MSLLPGPPGRPLWKNSRCPSRDSAGPPSMAVVLRTARFTGVSQGQSTQSRWETQMSLPPTPPARLDEKIEAQAIVGNGRLYVVHRRIDDWAEIHRGGPFRVREGRCGKSRGRPIGRRYCRGKPVGLGSTCKQQGEGGQQGQETGRGCHGASLPLGVRVDIQMSVPPKPLDRLEAKSSVRPSTDSPGC